jgi:SAM-dependent methyltransferase
MLTAGSRPIGVPGHRELRLSKMFPAHAASAASIPCPLCGSTGAIQFISHAIPVADCLGCGHRYADYQTPADHVEEVYGDGYFTGGGAGYADYLSEERLLRARGRWYAKKLRHLVPVGRVIDVGAAAGLSLLGFRDYGWTAAGVEPNERMARTANDKYKVDVVHSRWEDYQPTTPADLVTIVQVLPHLVDPAGALAKAASAVRDGGGVLVETWNADSFTARFFGMDWHEYSPPSVLHWFSPNRLSALAAKFGLHQAATGRPSKWIEAGHAKSLLRHKLNGSLAGRAMASAASIVPDRLALPYPAEDLFWMFFRKRS